MDYDLIIIGAGPGGYVAAIRAGQTGLKTVLIEKDHLGGMCLNWGCIPTKALLESAKRYRAVKHAGDFGVDGIDAGQLSFNWSRAVKRVERIVKRLTRGVEALLKKNGVDIIQGTAEVNGDRSVSVEKRRITAKHIIIATGSRPVEFNLPGGGPGTAPVDVRDLLTLPDIPEHVAVLGNGPHAIELAQFFSLIDRTVTLVSGEKSLIPSADRFLSDYAGKMLKKNKIDVLLSSAVKGLEDGVLLVEPGAAEDNAEKSMTGIPCQLLINAPGRRAVVPGGDIKWRMEKKFLKVNDFLQTPVEGIYAVGDVNGRSIFAHAASAQGLYVVNRINGLHEDSLFENEKFPINIYTTPELAQVGLNEIEAGKLKNGYKVSEFPLTANGKALAEGETEGLIRLLSDKKYGEVLGVQVVGSHATDMIAEAALAMQIEGTVYDVARTIHAHPTVSEIFMEAGYDAFDQPIHK